MPEKYRMCLQDTFRICLTKNLNVIEADPDDNKFVDCAVAGNAKFIVTEDGHYDILKDLMLPRVDVIKLDDAMKLLTNDKYPKQDIERFIHFFTN